VGAAAAELAELQANLDAGRARWLVGWLAGWRAGRVGRRGEFALEVGRGWMASPGRRAGWWAGWRMEHPYLAHLPPPHGTTLVLEEAGGGRLEVGAGMDRRGCARVLRLALAAAAPLAAAAAGVLCTRLHGRGLAACAMAACGLDLLLALCMYALLLGLLAVLASSADRARLEQHGRADASALRAGAGGEGTRDA